MNLEEKVINLSRSKYGENSYIEERIKKEFEIIRKKSSEDEIDFLLFLKENLDQNILIGHLPFISLYLLGLSLINPLPAHYYNEKTKELIFVEGAEYGVDLEKREGLCRDGFNIDPSYTFENDIYYEIQIDKKYKNQVENDIYKYFGENTIITEDRNEWRDKISYKSADILFLEILNDLYYEKNIFQDLDIEDFKKYLLEYHLNEKLELKNGLPWKVTEFIESSSYKENIKTYGDFLYLLGLTLTYSRTHSLFIDFANRNYPSNREEIFVYYLDHGIDRKRAGELTESISFFKGDVLPDIDPEIDFYLSKLNYTWPKTSLVKASLYSYLAFKLAP